MNTPTCPTCGGTKSKAAKQCQHCHLTAIAPLGWQATKAKYGEKTVVHHLQTYLLRNPSSLEIIVSCWLNNLSIQYEREVWIESRTKTGTKVYLVDFVFSINGVKFYLEINGTYVHQFHAERDAAKQKLLKGRGYPVLVWDDHTIKSGAGLEILQQMAA